MTLETIKYRGYTIEIEYDFPERSENPREWDNIWTFYCFHRRYYIGDKHEYCADHFSGWDEFLKVILADEDVILIEPLYIYEHSGTMLDWHPFPCGFDSGQVGFAFVTRDKLKWFDRRRMSSKLKTKIYDALEIELLAYNQWANGEIYAYCIYDDLGEGLGSCHGYYDRSYCIECAKNDVDYYRNKRGVECV